MEQNRRDVGGKFKINGKTYIIYGGVNPVGRNKEAVVNIKSLGVSQQHAIFILVNDDLHFISDLNSSNGTFVDNNKVNPFQLYRLNDGASIKFANIEGIYNKFSLQDIAHQGNITNISESTQNFTQNFYGSDTQIIDNTINITNTRNISPGSSYIPSQMLAEMAEKLEESYIEVLESATQVVNTQDHIKWLENRQSKINSNDDVHEAETQIFIAETVAQSPVNLNADEVGDTASEYNDAETQENSYKSNKETSLRSIIDLHEIEADTDITQDYTRSAEAKFTQDIENELRNMDNDLLTENTQNSPNDEGLKENILKGDTSGSINSNTCLSQEEEVIRPVGLSRNILTDSTNSLCGEADVEIMRPMETSINLLQTDNSAFDGTERKAEQIEICQKEKEEGIEELSDKKHDCEGSTSGGDNEESNKTRENPTESLDDSECVIRSAKKPWNLFESQESTDLEEDSNDSVDFMTMQKIPSTQKYFNSEASPSDKKSADVSETEIKISETSKNTNSSLDEVHYSDSETDIEENDSYLSGKNPMTKTEKQETHEEISDKAPQVASSICDESDIDIEHNLIPSNKNESIGLILEDSALDETFESSRKIENNVDLSIQNRHNTRSSNVHTEDLDDSDFIPTTQEEHLKPISQNSKYESSENSFKLGLTQLMEEEGTPQINTQEQPKINNDLEQKESQNESQSSTNNQKKFTFRKSLIGTTKSGDVTLELDEDIYQAATQNICENTQKIDHTIDDQGFLKPTQEAPKKEKQKTKNSQDDDIYILSTEKLDESSTQKLDKSSIKISDDDVYQQSTQKLIPDEPQKKSLQSKTTRVSDDFYQLPTQKIPLEKNKELAEISIAHQSIEDCDIFATQAMVIESPTKCLESELDHMFASQRVIPADDTLNKIKDIVCEKGISDDKLPNEDKDLEAILCTQKFLDSPKSPANKMAEQIQQKSVESQLEVIFASQTCNLVQDKFIRPANPLINILGEDSQNLPSNVENISSGKSITINENENTSHIKPKQKKQVGLEQSFALLEANSTKIRRSVRNKNLEEITVSCPKSEVSMALVSDNNVKREEVITSRNVKLSRKRQPPAALDNFVTGAKEPRRSKRSRYSEHADEDNYSDISSEKSDHSEQKKILNKIPEYEEVGAQRPEDKKHSSRKQKKKQSNENREDISSVVIEPDSSKSENENIKNKHLAKIQEDEQIMETSKRPVTPSRTRTTRKDKKIAQDTETVEHDKFDEEKDRSAKENIKNNVSNKKQIKEASEQPETPYRKRGSRMQKDAQNKQISEYEDLDLTKTKNKTKFSEAVGTNNIDDKVNVSKESDEASVDSGIEDSLKKRKTKEEEIKTSKPRSAKSNKNKNYSSTEKDIQEHPIEAPTKSKKREETNEGVTNNRNKSRHNLETPATPSRTTKRGCTTEVTIAQKIRKVSEETLSSSRNGVDTFGTPNRIKRKLKPKVVFTMMDNPRIESQIKLMGGSIVDSVDACTVLLTQSVKRSMKLLSAVGLGKPICSENWVLHSKKENNFLDPWDFILKDKEAEKKWDFSLKTSLERSMMSKLFEGYTFQLLVSNALDVLKGAIESCGGKIVTKTPKGVTNFIIVASTDLKDKYKKLLKQKPDLIIVEPEAIFDGVLRQEIRFERHLLK